MYGYTAEIRSLSLSFSLSRLSVFIRKKRKGSSANCTEILAWNLFQITWTRVLSPWWTYGGHLFYHCWKELERGQWGQKVQWILSVPSPTSAITDGIIREVGADIFKFRAIFSRTKKGNKKSFIRFPRFRKTFKHFFMFVFRSFSLLVFVTLSLYSLIKEKDRIIDNYDHLWMVQWLNDIFFRILFGNQRAWNDWM